MRDVQEMTAINVGLRMMVDITTRGCRWRTCRLPQHREDLSGILDEDTIESVGDSGAGRQQNQAEIELTIWKSVVFACKIIWKSVVLHRKII